MLEEFGHYLFIGFTIGVIGTLVATGAWIIYNLIQDMKEDKINDN